MAERGVRRRGRGFGARGGFKRQQQTHDEPQSEFESPELRQLREKHGDAVELVQAVFSDWDEPSVLYLLSETGGSVDTAINRIVEGQAEQWGSVKPKKQQQKKEASLAETAADGQASSTGAPARGSFGGRGRGRGEFRGGRGGFRGTARGGRGGAASARQPANGEVTVTEVTDVAASADGTVTATTVTEASGEGVTEISVQETSTDAEGMTVQVQESIAVTEKPQQASKPTNGWAQKGKAPAVTQAAAPSTASKKAPQAGVKLSWAQIARPPSPKVQPAPAPKAAPVQQAPEPVEPVVVAEVVAQAPEPVIVVEVPAAEPEAPETAPQDPWSSTPAAAVIDTEAQQPAEPEALSVGEGWADSIIAKNDYAQSQDISPEQRAAQDAQHQRAQEAAPPAGVDPAGALDVHTPAPSEIPSQQSTQQPERMAAPPGLSKRASAIRGKQDAPVVMPGSTPDIERIGVQFGSLNLFGSIPTESAAEELPTQQQQSLYETPAAQQQQEEYQQPAQSIQETVQQAQQAPAPYDIQQQAQAQYYQSQAQKQTPQYGGVFDRLGTQPQQHYQQPQQQQQAPASAYSSRYQPFGQPAQQQQQDPFAAITSPYLQNVVRTGSAQQQPAVPSLTGADSISPYYSSQQAQNLQSHQGTQAQQTATSPAPQNARESAGSVPPQQSAYGGFTSAIGQATQAQQPQQQQGYPSDYANFYGMQDQTRNLQSYYGQSEQPAQQQYRPSATDDLTAKLGASSATASSGLNAQQQPQQLGQQQQHYNPNMMGGYNYPYYPYAGYGNPSYGNPNYPAYPSQAPYNYGATGNYGAYGQNRNAYQGGASANHAPQNSTGGGSNAYSRTSGLGGYGNNASAGLSGSAGAPHASGYGSNNAYGSFDSSRGLSQGGNAQGGAQGLGQAQQDRSASNNDAFNDPRYSSNY